MSFSEGLRVSLEELPSEYLGWVLYPGIGLRPEATYAVEGRDGTAGRQTEAKIINDLLKRDTVPVVEVNLERNI